MYPVENHGDWTKGISGSRRMTCEAVTENSPAMDEMTGEPQRGQQEVALLSANDTMPDCSSTQTGQGLWARFSRRCIERQNGNHLRLMATSEAGPVDLIQAIRGILLFGILATVIWLEWVAIREIATYFATYL